MPDPSSQPANGNAGASFLGNLNPDELFARGMQSVQMTGAGGLTTWEPPTVKEAARLFPNYEVLELIGRGGMGAVYKARQLALDRLVAIKLLPLEVSVDRDFAERFKREARTMAKMSHPHIVSVFDFGTTTEGHLFFVMEYVEGTTLHHIIKTTGLMPPQALEIIMGVCEALNYAHQEGVVHRDIKPANVLVDVRGRVKVTDFGLARLNNTPEQNGYTMTGTVLGTPDYMAPEQKRGMRVDHRADIYSLGVMLYEMLCGQVPQGIFDPPSIRVGVDERVDQVVIRATQQEPDRRYQNTAEMRHEVQTIRQSVNPNAKAPQPRQRDGTPVPKKNNGLLIVAATVAVIAAAAFAYVMIFKDRKPEQQAPGKLTGDPASVTEKPAKPEPTPAPSLPKPPDAIASTNPSNPATNPAATSPTPPLAIANAPATTSVQPGTAPGTTSIRPPISTERPVSNPAMATAVAQIAPTRTNPNPALPPPPAMEPWRESVEQGDTLLRERDRDGAAQAFERALDQAQRATTAVAPLELARIHQKIGNIAAQSGSAAEARGSYEDARRELAKIKGKSVEATQIATEIDASLRRLPRE